MPTQKLVDELRGEVSRLNEIAFGETDCYDCCNKSAGPLLGCGLSEEQWLECTGDKYHFYWNKKIGDDA
jgi:hypothetical protein